MKELFGLRATRCLGGAPSSSAALALGCAAVVVATLATAGAAGAQGLPDGRVYEQVSPLEKNGNEAGAVGGRAGYGVATGNGERLVYGTSGAVGNGPTGVGPSYSVSQRTSGGWTTRGALPRGVGLLNFTEDAPAGLFYPSSALSSFAFATRAPFVSYGGDERHSPNLYLTGEDTSVEPAWASMPRIPNPVPQLGQNPSNELPAPAGPPSPSNTIYFAYFGTLLASDSGRAAQLEAEGLPGHVWGFYEWRDGALSYAGVKPDGSVDPNGAVPAATVESGEEDAVPDIFDNQVSADGTRAVFVSPDPKSPHPPEDPVELYVRLDGTRTVLVSRDALAGGTPAPGYNGPGTLGGTTVGVSPFRPPALCPGGCPEPFAYALPSGRSIYFESEDKLARGPAGEEPAGSGPWTYRFDVDSESLTYLPGVSEPILAATSDGGSFAFVKYTEGEGGEPSFRSGELDLWSAGHIARVAVLPEAPFTETTFGNLVVAPVRITKDGAALVFDTNAPVANAKDSTGTEPANNGGGFLQVYRYDARTAEIRCLSCPPHGVAPAGDAKLSNDDQFRDREHETSAGLLVGSRGVDASGDQVFFDTPEALVSDDINAQRDVYEWEKGHLYLISPGRESRPSFFLDNSEDGSDVFFATSASLAPGDTDGAYDVYDARVDGGFPTASPPTECLAECQGPPSAPPSFATPASSLLSGAGNLSPPAPAKPKARTRRQLLAKALRACRSRHGRRRRALCERRARLKYGGRRARRSGHHKGKARV